MKQIIDGKTYNTDTADCIGNYSNGLGQSDFNNIDEDLYITKKGAFFLYGDGGAMTKYSEPCGNMTREGSGIIPLSEMEALSWMENNGDIEDIEKHFSGLVKEA